MSIKVTNSYGGYDASTYSTTGKKNTAAKSGNSSNNVDDYYEKLRKKFPKISFNTQGGVMPCSSNKVVVNLSHDCLEKMASDPEFAKEVEWNLSGEVAANSLLYSWAKRDGVELGGPTVQYDANGNRVSSCGGMRTANASNKSSDAFNVKEKPKWKIADVAKKTRQDEFLKKAIEKRKRNKEYLEKMRKKQKERDAYISEITETDGSAVKDMNMTIKISSPAEGEETKSTIDIRA